MQLTFVNRTFINRRLTLRVVELGRKLIDGMEFCHMLSEGSDSHWRLRVADCLDALS